MTVVVRISALIIALSMYRSLIKVVGVGVTLIIIASEGASWVDGKAK